MITHLASFLRTPLSGLPEQINFLVNEIFDLVVVNSGLVGYVGIVPSGVEEIRRTIETSKISLISGLTRPNSRWNRIECNTAFKTSLAVRLSST